MKLFRQTVLKIQPCGELLKLSKENPGSEVMTGYGLYHYRAGSTRTAGTGTLFLKKDNPANKLNLYS